MTTKEEIGQWFERGVRQGATHMIVVCDSFDYEDYPVFVAIDEKVDEVVARYDGQNMQRVMEVYDLRKDRHGQLAERRAYNL